MKTVKVIVNIRVSARVEKIWGMITPVLGHDNPGFLHNDTTTCIRSIRETISASTTFQEVLYPVITCPLMHYREPVDGVVH